MQWWSKNKQVRFQYRCKRNDFVFVILFFIYSFNNGQILGRLFFFFAVKLKANSFKPFICLGLFLDCQKSLSMIKECWWKLVNSVTWLAILFRFYILQNEPNKIWHRLLGRGLTSRLCAKWLTNRRKIWTQMSLDDLKIVLGHQVIIIAFNSLRQYTCKLSELSAILYIPLTPTCYGTKYCKAL